MSLIGKFARSGKNISNYKIILSCLQKREYSSPTSNAEPEDTPVKYSTSPASQWRAEYSRRGDKNERLWYEPFVVSISLGVFLAYFGIFREENDIDDGLKVSLYDRIEGLEETQLKISLEHNKMLGRDTSDIIKRLKEIEEEKKANGY